MSRSGKASERASTHICISCGTCCRDFPYIQLSQNNIEKIASFTGLTSEEFSHTGGQDGEKLFMKFKEDGDCVFLNMTDGAYTCRAYEARSNICREYPANDIQDSTCRKNSDRQQLKKI